MARPHLSVALTRAAFSDLVALGAEVRTFVPRGPFLCRLRGRHKDRYLIHHGVAYRLCLRCGDHGAR